MLARHGVQGETRRHFGDTASAFGNHDKVDYCQDDKYDDTNRVVAADQEVAKGFNNLASRIRTGVSLQQNDPSRGHVERQAQQRGYQQDARKDREIERLLVVHGNQQNHYCQRNIECKEQIEDKCRQRQHHHR